MHLAKGDVIRADDVREYTDRIEYTVDHHTHRLSPESVKNIDGCASVAHLLDMKEGGCIPGGRPSLYTREPAATRQQNPAFRSPSSQHLVMWEFLLPLPLESGVPFVW